jgi:hypothetical protein
MNHIQVIHMRRCIVLITLALLAVSVVPATKAAFTGKTVIFVPFYDESGYRGPWNLRMEVPQMLGDMLGGADEYFTVLPVDSVLTKLPQLPEPNIFQRFGRLFINQRKQIIFTDREILSAARALGADFAVTGVIGDFAFKRRGAGEPMIGGYKSYTSSVKINQVRILRVSDGRPIGTVSGEQVNKSGGLGLELLGKPRQLDREFYSLDSLEFGTKGYLSTLMGQTTVEALNKVHKEIRTVVARPDSNWFVAKNFRILTVDRGNAVINAGSADGVTAGDEFLVFAADSGTRVGRINVIAIMSEHIARCEIIDGQDEIRPEDTIRPEM